MNKNHLRPVIAVLVILISSCGGNPNQAGDASTVSTPARPNGESIYKRTCITCHQANGEGLPNTFPPLAKSDYLADKERAIGQVLKGSSGEILVNGKKFNNTMPPQQLSDDEIASVLTFVYSSFGNNGSSVTAEEVKTIRTKL